MSPSQQPVTEKSDNAGDDDVGVGSMSPVGSVLTDGKDELALSRQSTISVTSASPSSSGASSSMNYEFSNVRVSKTD